ncbi:MAG: hypothetical protein KKA79_08350 [Nanoarchaeota archaeon]|nr:hypothetical protein [Nanoarchaeota archaeon]
MKLPKSFRPKKNLEDKTEQLIKEAKKLGINYELISPKIKYLVENLDFGRGILYFNSFAKKSDSKFL